MPQKERFGVDLLRTVFVLFHLFAHNLPDRPFHRSIVSSQIQLRQIDFILRLKGNRGELHALYNNRGYALRQNP